MNNIRLYSQNVRSISRNFDKLKVAVADSNYEFICIQETWRITTNYYLDNYYRPYYKCRQDRRGGGVLVWVRIGTLHNLREDLSVFREGIYESIAVEISCKGKNLILINTYRPPKGNVGDFCDELSNQIEKVYTENKIPIIVGDINLNYRNLGNDHPLNILLQTRNLIQLINTTTRYDDFRQSKTIVDHIYAPTRLQNNCKASTKENHIADHLGLILEIKNKRAKELKREKMSIIKVKPADISNIKTILTTTNWEKVFKNCTATEMATSLQNKIDAYINQNCVRQVKPMKEKLPWYTRQLNNLRKKLNKHRQIHLADKDSYMKKYKYKQAKRDYEKQIFLTKNSYYEKVLETANAKQTWKIIKEVTGQQDKEELNVGLKESANSAPQNRQKIDAEVFNKYFSEIANTMTRNIPETNVNPHKYKPEQIECTFKFKEVSEASLHKCIKTLKPKTSYGTDKISNKLLKQVGEELIHPMRIIVNQSIATKTFPENWKTAKVKPLHKKGNKADKENYRPISLLPSLSKILEKIMVHQITKYYEANKLFPENQYGYRRGLSTMDAVNKLKEKILNLNKKKKTYSLVYLDYSKAFDTINHSVLYDRLRNYGFDENAVELIRSYLSNRKQATQVGNKTSLEVKTDNIGCPQGSCLGPLLYIMYTADMANIPGIDLSVFFADDTSIIIEHNPVKFPNIRTQTEATLEGLQNWVMANKLCLNVRKTVVYMMRDKQKNVEIKIGQDTVPITTSKTSTKYLGVLMNPELNWHDQANKVLRKVRAGISALYRSKHALNSFCLKLIQNAMIESHIYYAYEAWIPEITISTFSKLQKIHKTSLRLVGKTKRLAHTAPICRQYKLLQLEDRLELFLAKKLILAYKKRKTTDVSKTAFIFRDTNTRTGIQLVINTNSHKLKQLYQATYQNYRDIITSDKTVQTNLKHIRAAVEYKYEQPCRIEKCYVCSK